MSRNERKTSFANYLKAGLTRINQNLYLNPGDPMYYEKVLRYADPHSPEAHYRVGEKHERAGRMARALFHYTEAARHFPSPYYYLAKGAERRLLEGAANLLPAVPGPDSLRTPSVLPGARPAAMPVPALPPAAAWTPAIPDEPHRRRAPVPHFARWLLAGILILALLLVLWNGPGAVRGIVSIAKQWTIGREVVHETTDAPFAIYFPYSAPVGQVEETMFRKALSMSADMPGQNLLLYGFHTEAAGDEGAVQPLLDMNRKKAAFVLAEFNPALDKTVRIRFLDPGLTQQAGIAPDAKPASAAWSADPPGADQAAQNSPQAEGRWWGDKADPAASLAGQTVTPAKDPAGSAAVAAELEAYGANLVRTALQAYIGAKGHAPLRAEQLTGNYPDNFLSFIPLEPFSGSNRVTSRFDGQGGWVYQPEAAATGEMFFPNVADKPGIPFAPVGITIDKRAHLLILENGPRVLALKTVGLGREDRTPEGVFPVADRVLAPRGRQANVYGTAGLGLGAFAIHGTEESDSIGADRSLGCIRMADSDIAGLFPLVPKGTVVTIEKTQTPGGVPEAADIPEASLRLITPPGPADGIETAPGRVFNWLG